MFSQDFLDAIGATRRVNLDSKLLNEAERYFERDYRMAQDSAFSVPRKITVEDYLNLALRKLVEGYGKWPFEKMNNY